MASGNIIDIAELKSLHQAGARLFGLDLGSKTIGIAVSDGLLTIASAFHTIRRVKFGKDVAELLKLAGENRVFGLVIGLPLNMDGSEGPRVQATRAFVRNLAPLSALPVVLWDERLSTVAAERAMLEADLSRRKRAEKIDAAAAAFILQGALDRLRQL
ncbi:MAG: Holliday junction resolvase RuvX [Nitratireductor sp.]|nr:Holliday junction resolvase RuvX [Nitratireductor sp.]